MIENLVVVYAAAGVIGLALGLFGGGGSVLTLPVLVYLAGINPVLATAYSLFVVGTTALIATVSFVRNQLVDSTALLTFGLPSLCAVYLTRLYVVPLLPEEIGTVMGMVITKNALLMLTFSLMMAIAGLSMIRPGEQAQAEGAADGDRSVGLAIAEGLFVGFITGLVGAGGGFIIVPMLAVRWKLPLRVAIGTSLGIIAIKSLCGFVGDLQLARLMDWPFLLRFSAAVIAGMGCGIALNRRAPIGLLRVGFGWFVLLAALGIVIMELNVGYNPGE